MLPPSSLPMPLANHVLCAAGRRGFKLLAVDLELVSLRFGEILYEPGDEITWLYFPNDALVSLLTVVDKHLALEVGMVGCEGFVGVSCALGINVSSVRAMVQGEGTAMRMTVPSFAAACQQLPTFQREVLRFTQALMSQIAQTAGCNRFHAVEARLARWLLMTRDRLGRNQFHLTHEFLGSMLGVRRVGVTEAAHHLKNLGWIDYSRGHINIVNDLGLESAACSCYRPPMPMARDLCPPSHTLTFSA